MPRQCQSKYTLNFNTYALDFILEDRLNEKKRKKNQQCVDNETDINNTPNRQQITKFERLFVLIVAAHLHWPDFVIFSFAQTNNDPFSQLE